MALRTLLLALLLALSPATGGHRLSYVETSGSFVRLYDDHGHLYKTMSSVVTGEVIGYSSTMIVTRSGSFIHLHDSEGVRYKSLPASTTGEVLAVAGDTFTTRSGNMVHTYDSQGRLVGTRLAR